MSPRCLILALLVVVADHGGGGVIATEHHHPNPVNERIPLVLAGPGGRFAPALTPEATAR